MSFEQVMTTLDKIATALHHTPVGNAKTASVEEAKQVHQSSTLAGIDKFFKEGGLAKLRKTGNLEVEVEGESVPEPVNNDPVSITENSFYKMGMEHWKNPRIAKSCIMFASTALYKLVKTNTPHPIEIFHRPPTMTVAFEHYFVVVGRPQHSSVLDYHEWSDQTCVFDMWLFNQAKIHVPFAPIQQIREDAKGKGQKAGEPGHFRVNLPGGFGTSRKYRDRVVCRYNVGLPAL